jgi:hypothetical protein
MNVVKDDDGMVKKWTAFIFPNKPTHFRPNHIQYSSLFCLIE